MQADSSNEQIRFAGKETAQSSQRSGEDYIEPNYPVIERTPAVEHGTTTTIGDSENDIQELREAERKVLAIQNRLAMRQDLEEQGPSHRSLGDSEPKKKKPRRKHLGRRKISPPANRSLICERIVDFLPCIRAISVSSTWEGGKSGWTGGC